MVWHATDCKMIDGASLIYTTPSVPSSVQTLVHSSLGIQSLLKRQPLKHNVIDRDKVLVPPNWDSWGKIRVLRDGFDVEGVNKGWSMDIEEANYISSDGQPHTKATPDDTHADGVISIYEDTIKDPRKNDLPFTANEVKANGLEVETQDAQVFLAHQLAVLDRNTSRVDTSSNAARGSLSGQGSVRSTSEVVDDGSNDVVEDGRVNEHIGPVQFNMGGIQVDADDMLQRLKVSGFCNYVKGNAYIDNTRTDSHIKHPDRRRQGWPRLMVNLKTKLWHHSSRA